MDPETLAARLQHIYWLGGGSGAGKSTVSRRIAAQYDMRLYATDDVMGDHHQRCDPESCPYLTAFVNMNMDERWLNRSPQVMLDTFHWFRGEAFDLIVEDLLSFPTDQPVIVEGFRLLPALVEPLLDTRSRAVWLIPTAKFRRSALMTRGSLMDIAGKTSDPPRALENLLQRDEMFTSSVEREAQKLNLPVIRIDEAMTVEESMARVVDLFDLDGER